MKKLSISALALAFSVLTAGEGNTASCFATYKSHEDDSKFCADKTDDSLKAIDECRVALKKEVEGTPERSLSITGYCTSKEQCENFAHKGQSCPDQKDY